MNTWDGKPNNAAHWKRWAVTAGHLVEDVKPRGVVEDVKLCSVLEWSNGVDLWRAKFYQPALVYRVSVCGGRGNVHGAGRIT